jgi:hypothetical protein
VSQFRYLGTTITYQKLIQEENKRRLKSGNACYHPVQNLLSSHLRYKSIQLEYTKIQNGTNHHGSGTTNSALPAEISRVAVRLPPLWSERPAVWFAQAEAQFTLAGISSAQTQVLLRDLAVEPTLRLGSGGHHPSTETRPVHNTENRTSETIIPLKRAPHPRAPYTRDGRPQTVPVSKTPQKPLPRHA